MRLIVNVPRGTGRLIFASNEGSSGTMAMPHTNLTVGRAGNTARLPAFASGGPGGTGGLRSGVGDGVNNFENSGDE
jgi:hypothetical protein